MITTIKNLTPMNVQAIKECFSSDIVMTSGRTATFFTDAASATLMVGNTIRSLPGREHPKASLHAVARKLQAQIPPITKDDPRMAALSVRTSMPTSSFAIVDTLHDGCPECERAATEAITVAGATGSTRASVRFDDGKVEHNASVKRVTA